MRSSYHHLRLREVERAEFRVRRDVHEVLAAEHFLVG